MSKRDDQRIAALARKNAERIKPATAEGDRRFDDTLRLRNSEDPETRRLFKEMKKREF